MSPKTRFLARLLGLYCLLISAAMAAHKEATVAAITAMIRNPSVLFLTGVLGATAGLALVLNHNVWRGGAATVTVTLVGWAALSKGLLLLLLTPAAEASLFLDALRFEQWFYFYLGITFALGAWLAWSGFRHQSQTAR